MQVFKIEPQGFCKGVSSALRKSFAILENVDTPKPIYFLGMIVHNKKINDVLISKGAIILDDKQKTKAQLINMIEKGTIVFSAHGVSPKIRELATSKGLNIFDLTCPDVLNIQRKITEKLTDGFKILYYGSINHPECIAILEINPEIKLINKYEDINNLNPESRYYFANQSTLIYDDVKKIYDYAKSKLQHIECENQICLATTKRQNALINLNCDLCIVVGDKESSNTNNLLKIAKKSCPSILLETLDDLKLTDLENVKKIAITSGASTPNVITNEIIAYLESYDPLTSSKPVSHLSLDDFHF